MPMAHKTFQSGTEAMLFPTCGSVGADISNLFWGFFSAWGSLLIPHWMPQGTPPSECIPLITLCLWTPAVPHLPARLLNSRRPLLGPLPCSWPGNSLQAVSRSCNRAHMTCVPSLRDHGLELFDVQCLKTFDCIYFVQTSNCFRQEGKSSPCYSVLARGKSSSNICWTSNIY